MAGLHGVPKAEVDERFDEIVDFAGPQVRDGLDMAFRHFSSGMKVRLGFSVITTLEEPIVLVDEVLAVGDKDFREKCYTRMESLLEQGRTLFLVSHSELRPPALLHAWPLPASGASSAPTPRLTRRWSAMRPTASADDRSCTSPVSVRGGSHRRRRQGPGPGPRRLIPRRSPHPLAQDRMIPRQGGNPRLGGPLRPGRAGAPTGCSEARTAEVDGSWSRRN